MKAHPMQKLWENVLDIFFPPRADEMCVRQTSEDMLLSLVNHNYRTTIGIPFMLSYQNPVVRALIHEAKFEHNDRAIHLLAIALSCFLKELSEPYALIPIPLSSSRERSRGYNQVTEILKEALSLSESPHVFYGDTLHRARDTAPQTTLTRKERLLNLRNAFSIENECLKTIPYPVLIIDDVTTTGATLIEAKSAIQQANRNASIHLCAIAH